MRRLLLTVVMLCGAASTNAQISLDKNILVDQGNCNIDVYLRSSSVKGWNDPKNWTIVTLDPSGNVKKVEIKKFEDDPALSMFSLVTGDKPEDSPVIRASQLILRFGSKDLTTLSLPQPPCGGPPKPTKPASELKPASGKQNADLYISGTYSPAINSAPQYQIDSSANLMWDIDRKKTSYGQLGFLAAVTTDKRKEVDPDSYRVFGAYQGVPVAKWYGPVQGVLFTWLFAGAEFDRKANNINFITAPSLDFPTRIFPKIINAGTVPMAIFVPTIGVEAGHNFRNVVTPDGRGVFRGVIGGTFLFRFNPKIPGFKGVELSSAYKLRLPAIDEVFTSTKMVNGKAVDVPFLSSKPRHYIKEQLDFKLTDAFSLTLKHEYGAIPPAFRMADHKASVGFTYSLRQTRDGLPGAIRDK
jgi:hypothetical protein